MKKKNIPRLIGSMEELIKSNQQKIASDFSENVVGDVKSTAGLRCNGAQF